jgi:hypothetical protein
MKGIYNGKNIRGEGNEMKVDHVKLAGAVSLIALGVLGRVALRPFVPAGSAWIAFDLFAVMGIISLLAGVLLGGKYGIAVPLTAMAISDLVLGNGMIFIFTWSGFALMGYLGVRSRKMAAEGASRALTLTGVGVAGILAFDLWTNLGWFLIFYPHTAAGLATCFALAVPFMVGHLLTTAALMPAVSMGALHLQANAARVRKALRLPVSA